MSNVSLGASNTLWMFFAMPSMFFSAARPLSAGAVIRNKKPSAAAITPIFKYQGIILFCFQMPKQKQNAMNNPAHDAFSEYAPATNEISKNKPWMGGFLLSAFSLSMNSA